MACLRVVFHWDVFFSAIFQVDFLLVFLNNSSWVSYEFLLRLFLKYFLRTIPEFNPRFLQEFLLIFLQEFFQERLLSKIDTGVPSNDPPGVSGILRKLLLRLFEIAREFFWNYVIRPRAPSEIPEEITSGIPPFEILSFWYSSLTGILRYNFEIPPGFSSRILSGILKRIPLLTHSGIAFEVHIGITPGFIYWQPSMNFTETCLRSFFPDFFRKFFWDSSRSSLWGFSCFFSGIIPGNVSQIHIELVQKMPQEDLPEIL